MDETMQKAALWNMPVAVAVAKDLGLEFRI